MVMRKIVKILPTVIAGFDQKNYTKNWTKVRHFWEKKFDTLAGWDGVLPRKKLT
jgi:hypothetical protein